MQLVMAAMTTAPLESGKASPLFFTATSFAGEPSTTFVNEDFRILQRDAILRALGAGNGRFDAAKIQFQLVAEQRLGCGIGAEERLFLAIRFDERNLFVTARGEPQISKGFVVDGEEAHGCAVFRGHVGDGGAIRNAQAGKTGAVELHEFSDDSFLAQHFRDGEYKVRCRRAFRHTPVKFEADYFGNQHRQRLAEHGRLCFNSANAPAKDAERIHHGGVRIRADERIGISFQAIAVGHGANHARQILDVHLMADAGVWRDDFEIAERVLSPAEKLVALDVALEFQFGVEAERIGLAEAVHLNGVIDHQFGREERIDALGIAAEFLHGFAHGGQVDDRGHAGEIL